MKTEDFIMILSELIKQDTEPLHVLVPQWQYDDMKAKGYDVDGKGGGFIVVPFQNIQTIK